MCARAPGTRKARPVPPSKYPRKPQNRPHVRESICMHFPPAGDFGGLSAACWMAGSGEGGYLWDGGRRERWVKAQTDVMSPDTRLGVTSSHPNHQTSAYISTSICNVSASTLSYRTYQLIDQSINNGCNVSLPRDTRNVVVHKQMRAKELHAYKYMDKSSTDILWLTNELGDTHKMSGGTLVALAGDREEQNYYLRRPASTHFIISFHFISFHHCK